VIEDVLSDCFITRFRAAVSVLVGPCCPALPNCIDVDVHTVALLMFALVLRVLRTSFGFIFSKLV